MKVGSASRLEPSTEIGMMAPSIKASIASSAIIPKVHSLVNSSLLARPTAYLNIATLLQDAVSMIRSLAPLF